MIDYPVMALVRTLDHLGSAKRRLATAAHLRRHATEIRAELQDTVLAEVPAFTASRDPATLRELALHGPQHLEEVLRLVEGGAVRDLNFVGEHARLRAEHRFPLEALLHAYRCSHKVFARWLRSAAGAADVSADVVAGLVDFGLEYTDAISTVASAAYVERTRQLADVAGDQRAQLLNILLDGYDESDARVAAILRRGGFLDSRQTFCVVLAQSVDASEMASPERARRLVDAIDQLVPAALAQRLIDVRNAHVTCVLSAAHRASGWTAPGPSLASRIATLMATAGNGVLIGVSQDVASTSRIPVAHRQALLAMRMTSRTRRVIPFADVALRELMIHLAGDELARLLPAWAGDFYDADDKLGGALSATLHAYADADMNLLKAAARLELHPNTLYARMNRIRDITQLNARAYRPLTDLLTVADARAAVRPPD